MPITPPLDKHEDSWTRNGLVKMTTAAVSGAMLLVLIALAHHDTTGGWIVDVRSLLAGLRGPYTPIEKVTLGSAGFSLLVSVALEGILFYGMREGENKTKLWIRTTIFLILAVNIALALSAFVFTLVDNAMLSDLMFTASNGLDIWDTAYRSEKSSSTWSCELTAYQNIRNNTYSVGRTCRSRLASRWLSLFIFIFSMILVALAWLDFRNEDLWQRASQPLDEESGDNKDYISFIES